MPTLGDEQIASFFALEEVQTAKRKIDTRSGGSVYFTVSMTETIKAVLRDSFGLELPSTATTKIPMRWIKGDVAPHIDVGIGNTKFNTTHLLYLTDSPGELVLAGKAYPITKGTAHMFPESVRHETINTGSEPRLLLGPMSEDGFAVGGTSIAGPGGTTVYIRQDGGDYQYRYEQEISWNEISWQTEVENTNPDAGMLTIEFVSDIILSSSDQCFVCRSSHIQFGSTSLKEDGTRPVIKIEDVPGYFGLIQNGVEFESGYSNISIFNLVVDGSGSTLAEGGGWFGQQYFGKEATSNYIVNCSSDGPISEEGGGIVGYYAGSGTEASLTLLGCSSSGNIDINGGGIVGRYAGSDGGSIRCESCWSTGYIGENSGGITGDETENATIQNCYSTGDMDDDAGGICGEDCENSTITNCYSTGSIGNEGGGIVGQDANGVTITNCYSTGDILLQGGGILGDESSNYTIQNCYTVGDVSGGLGYIIGNSAEIPDTCYSEAKEEADNDGGVAGTWSSVHTIGILLPGTIWCETIINQPFELTAMGYTPYTRANIDISGGIPSLKRSISSSVAAGSPTAGAIIEGRSYTVLRITGDSDSFSSIVMDPTTGVISTTAATAPGTYTIYVRNTGSYNITLYELTVTGGGGTATTTITPCCARPTYRRGPLTDNATLTALTAGNTYLGSVRRGPISYTQLMAMKKAKASKK